MRHSARTEAYSCFFWDNAPDASRAATACRANPAAPVQCQPAISLRLVSWTDGDGSSMVCADSPDVLMVYCAVSRLRVHFLDLVPSVRFESADIQCVATLAGRNRSGPLRGQAFCSWQRTARWKCYQCTAADGLLFRIFEYCPRTILFQSWRIFRL